MKDNRRVFFKNAFKRFCSESDLIKIKRIIDLFERLGLRFTFFVVGGLNEYHGHFIREIHSMGHEIAAHGFRHRSYNSMTREEIEKDLLSCKDAFDQIGITVKGFRPPFLSYKEEMYSVAMDLGYTYVSGSVSYNFPLYKNFAASDEPTPKAHGRLIELPITTLSDFDLISYEGKSIMEAVDHWKMSVGEQSTLLFHPFLAGAKENLPPLEDFFRFIKGEFEVATACEKAEGKKGVSLTMDVGVLTKWDLIRALF